MDTQINVHDSSENKKIQGSVWYLYSCYISEIAQYLLLFTYAKCHAFKLK